MLESENIWGGELKFANQPLREHIEHLEGHLQNLKDGIARNESSISFIGVTYPL